MPTFMKVKFGRGQRVHAAYGLNLGSVWIANHSFNDGFTVVVPHEERSVKIVLFLTLCFQGCVQLVVV